MAVPEEKLEEKETLEGAKPETKKSGFNMKLLVFGLPAFIIQLIIVYFITANFLIKKFEHQNNSDTKTETAQNTPDTSKKVVPPVELGKFIYTVEDIIVNPANTDGKRLLLTNLGFDVNSADMVDKLKSREAMVKDAVISTLSSKNIAELNNTSYRDTLKTEITGKLAKLIPEVKINRVYFSKYIIQ